MTHSANLNHELKISNMMDSQENVLNQEAQLEENKVVETPVENEVPAEEYLQRRLPQLRRKHL